MIDSASFCFVSSYKIFENIKSLNDFKKKLDENILSDYTLNYKVYKSLFFMQSYIDSCILWFKVNEEFIKKLLTELFTKDEQDMIQQRLRIVTLLRRKMPQYEIAKHLNASLCSITRGAKELKKEDSALAIIVDKYLIHDKEFQESLLKSQ